MRIAHITDLHMARTPSRGEYNAKRLLGHVNYRLFRSRRYREEVAEEALARLMRDTPPDAILLSGDITQHGLDAEFDAAERLLSLVRSSGIPVLAVPGNHDIYGSPHGNRLRAFLEHMAFPLRPDAHGIFHLPGVELLPLAQGIPTLPFFSCGKQSVRELEEAGKSWNLPPNGVMRLACGHYPILDPFGNRLAFFHGLRNASLLAAFCRNAGWPDIFAGIITNVFPSACPADACNMPPLPFQR